MKRISVVIAVVLCLVFSISNVHSQSTNNQDRNIYSYYTLQADHPDGTVGELSISFSSSYLSIKNQPGQPVVDAQKFEAGITWVPTEKFSERQSFKIIKEFETTYELSFGFSYYLANPVNTTATVNPDGKTGSPVVSLDAVMLLDNFKETKSNTNIKAKILLPLSNSFSIFGGFTNYEKISSKDVEKIFGGLHIFLSSYTLSERYSNPDSPLSGMAVLLLGGSSDFGNFGQIELAVPTSKSVTINLSARGDFLEAPHDKIYTGSLHINYYTGK